MAQGCGAGNWNAAGGGRKVMRCLQHFAVGCFTFWGGLRIGWPGFWREAGREGEREPQNRKTAEFWFLMGREVLRMADTMLEEFQAWRTGKPLRYGVTPAMLRTMA